MSKVRVKVGPGLYRLVDAGDSPPARAAQPCRHVGPDSGPKGWHYCEHPDTPLGDVVCACKGCGPRCPGYARPPFEWVSTAKLAADAAVLAGLLPPGLSAVAGVPRSGMIPASIVATQLHLPLYELANGRLHPLGHGLRGRHLGFPSGDKIAVIDDTVYGGGAMAEARNAVRRIGERAVFAAVYVRPGSESAVDHFARPLASPHLLEWNFANGGGVGGFADDPAYGKGIGFDIDGVIVHDAESGGRVGSPYLVPRTHAVPLVATGRHERHRGVTEALLRSLGVKWKRLEMLPDGEEQTAENAAAHKARHYRASGCGFYVESDPAQAELIHRLSGSPVICPAAGRVFQ